MRLAANYNPASFLNALHVVFESAGGAGITEDQANRKWMIVFMANSLLIEDCSARLFRGGFFGYDDF